MDSFISRAFFRDLHICVYIYYNICLSLYVYIYILNLAHENNLKQITAPTSCWKMGISLQRFFLMSWESTTSPQWSLDRHLWRWWSPWFWDWIRLDFLFPTCQVRVVRFYQSACPPLPPPPPPPSPPPPRLAVLLASASSTSTSALPTLPTRRQALRQLPSSVRTAGRQPASCPAQCAQLTSTCELPSSVWTAGPQPGSCPAQCAPLDLNRAPPHFSVHRWTSTWDLPSSVCTAGPQRPDRMPEEMPDRMSEDMPHKMPWDMPDEMP